MSAAAQRAVQHAFRTVKQPDDLASEDWRVIRGIEGLGHGQQQKCPDTNTSPSWFTGLEPIAPIFAIS